MSIKFENTEVVGWEAAIRGMRNPRESWEKSDSFFCDPGECREYCGSNECDGYGKGYLIGPNDLDLMKRLRNAGTADHRKFMRMIVVYVDITAPLYWWKEFDTYKVGTVANSCSSMYSFHKKEFTLEDFSHEHINNFHGFKSQESYGYEVALFENTLRSTIDALNWARKLYLQTGDKQYWWQMIQLLPTSYNQKRTVMLNYEVLANIYKSRKGHRLDEWNMFCDWIETFPYSELITGDRDGK